MHLFLHHSGSPTSSSVAHHCSLQEVHLRQPEDWTPGRRSQNLGPSDQQGARWNACAHQASWLYRHRDYWGVGGAWWDWSLSVQLEGLCWILWGRCSWPNTMVILEVIIFDVILCVPFTSGRDRGFITPSWPKERLSFSRKVKMWSPLQEWEDKCVPNCQRGMAIHWGKLEVEIWRENVEDDGLSEVVKGRVRLGHSLLWLSYQGNWLYTLQISLSK